MYGNTKVALSKYAKTMYIKPVERHLYREKRNCKVHFIIYSNIFCVVSSVNNLTNIILSTSYGYKLFYF